MHLKALKKPHSIRKKKEKKGNKKVVIFNVKFYKIVHAQSK